ncbi:hypothetical protein GGR50DRAFT_663676 [Xylaria sp. CBS 124048]|nr:hypothetical protein GGR50DRAFT_663676 [Xylaria sp. CBS 124048]
MPRFRRRSAKRSSTEKKSQVEEHFGGARQGLGMGFFFLSLFFFFFFFLLVSFCLSRNFWGTFFFFFLSHVLMFSCTEKSRKMLLCLPTYCILIPYYGP